jgi:hypothetical protein
MGFLSDDQVFIDWNSQISGIIGNLWIIGNQCKLCAECQAMALQENQVYSPGENSTVIWPNQQYTRCLAPFHFISRRYNVIMRI